MTERMADQHEAQADGNPDDSTQGTHDWYTQGRVDATEGRFDPPAHASDRTTYQAGHQSVSDPTP